MEEEISRFDVAAPDGRVLTIVEIQEYVGDSGTLDNPASLTRGMKRLELLDGTPVTFVREGVYRVFDQTTELHLIR